MTNTIMASERMRRVIHTSQQVSNARVTPPGGGEPRSLSVVPLEEQPDGGGPAVEIQVPDTRQAGAYRIAWDEGPLGTQQDLYAANPDPRESALERIEAPELKSLWQPLPVEIASLRTGDASLFAQTGREIWRDLASALLVLLIVESIFATWVGRAR
jgi:hypothetical protein